MSLNVACAGHGRVFVRHEGLRQFSCLRVSAHYFDLGYQVGRIFGHAIRAVVHQRGTWHRRLRTIVESPYGQDMSRELMANTKKYFPHLMREIEGMASGCGLPFEDIWIMCIKSELMAAEPEPPGCSTIAVKYPRKALLVHNEDGNEAYRSKMFLLYARPPSGVDFISLVYPGILTGNGPSVNSAGIVQTTNYISSTKSSAGLPRYVLGRAALEARSLQEAVQIITMKPRSFPYHFNLISLQEQRYVSLETTMESEAQISPENEYVHTNHLLNEPTSSYAYEDQNYKNTSSLSRFAVIRQELEKAHRIELRAYLDILASHRQAPYSPCRHPLGRVKGRTLATLAVDIKQKRVLLYKGNPCVSVSGNLFSELII